MSKYKDIVDKYLLYNKKETENFDTLYAQFENKEEKCLIDRKNFVGHFTASAFVVSKNNNKVLMIHHKILKRYLQPGGHIDILDKNPLETSKRELFEETGINASSLKYKCLYTFDKLVPFNISIHMIPASIEKNEPAHYHYDLQYLFLCEEEMKLNINLNEVNSYEWVEWEIFKQMPGYEKVSKKIEKTLIVPPESFLYDFISDIKNINISCVAIQHITQSSIPLIRTLMQIFGKKLLVCAKPNSIDYNVWSYLEELGIRMKIASRNVENPVEYYEIKNEVVLIDIGGYFSNLVQQANLKILGIIEDTENGLKKYNTNINNLQYPLFSVARNPLKRNEDHLVGRDIVFGADYILHKRNLLLQYMTVACIGYGKIGRGICSKLREIGVKPYVLELNDILLIEAIREGCIYLPDKNFTDVDIIFCATGSQSLDVLDFRNINDGTYFVSATSSDDEFDLSYLEKEYKQRDIDEFITEYRSDRNYFYILNKGTPTNFAVGASLGDYILLVHGAIILAIKKILTSYRNYEGDTKKVYELTECENKAIASNWLNKIHKHR